jgi:hypothetical protein
METNSAGPAGIPAFGDFQAGERSMDNNNKDVRSQTAPGPKRLIRFHPNAPGTRGSSRGASRGASRSKGHSLRLKISGGVMDPAKESLRQHSPRGKDVLTALSDQINDFIRKNELSKRAVADIDITLRTARHALKKARKKKGGHDQISHNQHRSDRKQRTMENKLATKTQALCNEKQAVKVMKENINKSRLVINKRKETADKIVKEIASLERRTDSSRKSGYEALQQKEELEVKMRSEQHAEESAKLLFAETMQEKENILHATLNFKVYPNGDEANGKGASSHLKDGESKGKLSAVQEQALRTGIVKETWKSVRKLGNIAVKGDQLTTVQEAFDRISRETGIQDIDVLVEEFISWQMRTESAISLVNVLAPEAAQLHKEVEKAKNELDKFAGEVWHKLADSVPF